MDSETRRYQFGEERYPEPGEHTMKLLSGSVDADESERQGRVLDMMISRHAAPWQSNRVLRTSLGFGNGEPHVDEEKVAPEVLAAFHNLKQGCDNFLANYEAIIVRQLPSLSNTVASAATALIRDLARFRDMKKYPGRDALQNVEIFYSSNDVENVLYFIRSNVSSQATYDIVSEAFVDHRQLYAYWEQAISDS